MSSPETTSNPETVWERIGAAEMYENVRQWFVQQGVWWTTSMFVHMAILIVAGLVLGTVHVAQKLIPDAFETALEDPNVDGDLTRFDVGETPLEPTVLDTESLTLEAPHFEQTEQFNDNSPVFEERGGGMAVAADAAFGGLGGFDFKALGDGPAVTGPGGVGTGVGTGTSGGSGGDGAGFGGRGAGMRKAMVGGFGGTKQSERAVAAGLNWLARHQNPNGSWSLEGFPSRCKDGKCTGAGDHKSDTAATAMALLPFLAAGQTHQTKGPYQKNINAGLYWLTQNQKSDGNLAGGGGSLMYSHGLASIALCEAYGMSKDRGLGNAAQMAIKFIENAQDKAGGGWRYTPGQPGDTSVVGWQVMALKSGQMAGLDVRPATLEGAKKFLNSCGKGSYKGTFSYTPESGPTPTMSAVGLLCRQYMGMQRDDQAMTEGMAYLMRNIANPRTKNTYYWYYATQVMHNIPGAEWDQWNRTMRRILIDSQVKEGCAAGSWDPDGHSHGEAGGRIMITSLCTLTLEVYYRYLPLYKLDRDDEKMAKAE